MKSPSLSLLVVAAWLGAVACGGGGSDDSDEVATVSPTESGTQVEEVSTPTATPTPTELERYLAELEPEVVEALEVAYGAEGFDQDETRMAEFLHRVFTSTILSEFFYPGRDEQQLLFSLYPTGVSQSQMDFLAAAYGLVSFGSFGRPQGPTIENQSATPLFPAVRRAFITSPLAQCIVPAAYGSITSYSAEVIGYYTQCIERDGIVFASGPGVSRSDLEEAGEIVTSVLVCRPDVGDLFVEYGIRIVLYPTAVNLMDLPEVDEANVDLAGTVFRGGVRSVSGAAAPAGDNTTLYHEVGHLIHSVALTDSEVRALFSNATNMGLWLDTYAGNNHVEYFAELTEAYFGVAPNTAVSGVPIQSGLTTLITNANGINGVEELAAYDAEGYQFLTTIYCPR